MAEPTPAIPEPAAARVAAATAQAVAAEATGAEVAEIVENSAVAAAEDAIEDAEQAARDVALAAIHTQLGQSVAALDQRLTTWQNEHDQTHQSLTSELASLKATTAEILAKLSTEVPAPTVIVSSTQPASPGPATETTVAIPTQAESPGPIAGENAAPTKRRIKLI